MRIQGKQSKLVFVYSHFLDNNGIRRKEIEKNSTGTK